MAATPERAVHWDTNYQSPSDFGSPSLGGDDSTASSFAPSTLEYINSQLIAHGFAPPPGISLDGISAKDSERVVKCLMSFLSQRMQDMARTEDLSTKLRTMQYDYQRLTSMHRSAVETAAHAEREMNLHKSRLQSTQRALQNAEAAHKQTSHELQRTKTALQALRTAQAQENKKREKDLERLTEKWQKLADSQAKLTVSPSGIACVNVSPVETRSSVNKGPELAEIALDEAERARAALVEDNKHLKTLVLKAVNAVQRILYQTKSLLDDRVELPGPYTITTLFPMSATTMPNETLSDLLSDLRDSLETVSERLVAPPLATAPPSTSPAAESSASAEDLSKSQEENLKLQKKVTSLEEELTRYQRQLQSQAQEVQTLLNAIELQQKTISSTLSLSSEKEEEHQEERGRLEALQGDLEMERDRLRNAAIIFDQERAALEAQKHQFLEEKKSWEGSKMTRSFSPPLPPPPTLAAARVAPSAPTLAKPPVAKVFRAAKKGASPRKSPAKFKGASKPMSKASHPTAASSKPSGSSKVSTGGHTQLKKLSLASPQKVIPAFETEVLPPMPSLGRLSTLGTGPPVGLLPGAFVLPPPSPRASLPVGPALPPARGLSPPDFGSGNKEDVNPFAPVETQSLAKAPPKAIPAPQAPPPQQRSTTPQDDPDSPSTPPPPAKKPFPVAKPFAQRMIHAYSPAKPSPLSRILTLSESMNSMPDVTALPELSLVEEDVNGEEVDWDQYGEDLDDELRRHKEANFSYDENDTGDSNNAPTGMCLPLPTDPPVNVGRRAEDDEEESLAAQLGVSESPPQENAKAPLRERKAQSNGVDRPPSRGAPTSTSKGRVLPPDAKKTVASSKPSTVMKPPTSVTGAKAKPSTLAPKRIAGSTEKENEGKTNGTSGSDELSGKRSPVFQPPVPPATASRPSTATGPSMKRTVSSGSRPAPPTTTNLRAGAGTAKPTMTSRGGPRRVLLDSAEAPGRPRRS